MKIFAYVIFLSAFLLFQVQPMMARYILPWFGGSSSVWATCLLFFQAGLLIGYGYSHLLTRFLTSKNQVKVHVALLLLSVISIPIAPHAFANEEVNPVSSILRLLTLSAGFPYIIISATGPLLQYWFSLANPKKSPYRLYALSNLGSLIGLISYPFLIEPYLRLNTQTWFWSAGYLLFIVLCGMVAYSIWQLKPVNIKQQFEKEVNTSLSDKILWLLLSFMGVVALLSVTNKLTQDFVVVPFLWIAPLSLYLISFIIAFENRKWYKRKVFLPLMLVFIALILVRQIKFVVNDEYMPVNSTILIYCLGVFFICMALHGELAMLKPGKKDLTFFYLIISLGGVLGGAFINFLVPVIFDGYWEIYFAFCGSVLLAGYVLIRNPEIIKTKSVRTVMAVITIGLTTGILVSMKAEYAAFNEDVIASYRNFYGVLKISENNKGAENWQRTLIHGDILHGIQLMQPEHSRRPLTY